MNNKLCLIAFFCLTSFQSYAVGQAECALPDAGEEIAQGEIFGNTPLTEDEKFKKAVSLEGQYWSERRAADSAKVKIGELSGNRRNSAAAYARAKIDVEGIEGADDGILQTSGNININVKYAQVKNESWISTVSSEAPGNATFRITNVNKYMERLTKEYEKVGERLNPLTRRFIEQYITLSDEGVPLEDGGRLLSEVNGLPGMHAEVQAFNSIANIAEEEGITLTQDELRKITIATVRVAKSPSQMGADFVACSNCSGILSQTGVSIITNSL